MAITYDTRKIVEEVEAILKASKDLEKVTSAAVVPIAQETAGTAVYVSAVTVTATQESYGVQSDSYHREMILNLICNVDCEDDNNYIYDVTDSIERSVLKDNGFWDSIINRDVLAIEYDAQEHAPKRVANVLVKVVFKLHCD